MSSDKFALPTVADALEQRLAAAINVPYPFPIRDIDNGAKSNRTHAELTYEQTDVSAFFEGQRLADGWVAVNFELGLSAPEMDPEKGNETLFTLLPLLINALDDMDDIQWSTASKGRDSSGTFYKIPITLFATTKETDNG